MNRTTERVKALLQDIRQDTQHYDALADLLQQQRDAMIACDVTRTGEINQQLLSIYQQLHGSAQRRSETLQALKLSSDSQGIMRLLPHLPEQVAQLASNWWHTLEARAITCQQLNERNGVLLTMQQETSNKILHGETANFIYQR
ncbi:flagellar protein FlgN [Duffyella gerundensis]|jgi:flagella synthesis protein FlgN|uniref:flagellar protein FlgN n=1 Tax=Duffyella gerundensis TaxID=1619313 RepID=UPI001AE6036D|nr:flagellar protein FlgN [Duffyella gerundensis]QTO54753.1 flagellar protein FlgN [Duffyella gerundensis]